MPGCLTFSAADWSRYVWRVRAVCFMLDLAWLIPYTRHPILLNNCTVLSTFAPHLLLVIHAAYLCTPPPVPFYVCILTCPLPCLALRPITAAVRSLN
jgi:hypothetical protein